MIQRLGGTIPRTNSSIFIADNCSIIGNVLLGKDTSVWYGAVIRGDVTVGHAAILHTCTIRDNVLIGMGSRILNGAEIGENCIVGAGALVPPGKRHPSGSLLLGIPARVARKISEEEIHEIRKSAERYMENARRFAGDP